MQDLPGNSEQAAEKGSYASLCSIDFASTYKSTPPLIDLRAPCLWTFLSSLLRKSFAGMLISRMRTAVHRFADLAS
jgi:hypothetical protein